MTFRNPFAWIGLAALIVPIAIHLLVRAPAQPIVLASLRFVSASPMRALRRRLLNDGALLALRLGILALAVAALADPLTTPSCRRAAWNARLTRAVVADPRAEAGAIERARTEPAAFASTVIAGADAAAGLARALVWLDAAPAARREVVFVGPFQLGALDEDQWRSMPASVGRRFVRTPAPPLPGRVAIPTTTMTDAQHRPLARSPQAAFERERLLTWPGESTPLPDDAIEPAPHGWKARLLGVNLAGPDAARPALRAALVAAMTVGVPIPSSAPARSLVVLADPTGDVSAFAPDVTSTPAPWMAETVDAIARDIDLARELRGLKAVAADPPAAPWRTVLHDAEARVLVAAAASPRPQPALVIRVRASAASPALAAVLRSALGSAPDTRALAQAEPLTISDAQLAAWTRPAGDVDARTLGLRHESDRAWLWGAALAALVAEAFLRRRPRRAKPVHESGSHDRAA